MRSVWFGVCAAVATFVTQLPAALANGEAGPNPVYVVMTTTSNSVIICPQGTSASYCPGGSGMLRQDVSTGQVVRLADDCYGPVNANCYVDECVPPGTYLYGYATPFECCEECTEAGYYGVAKVQTDLPATCTRSEGHSAPTPVSDAAPWPPYDPQAASPNICDSAGPSSADGQHSDGGCSVHGRARAAALGGHLLGAAAGIWWMARRRRRS